MRRQFLALGIAGGLLASSASAAQITSYVAENGRRVYVNAEEPPKPKKVAPKKSGKYSVLVQRDRRTNELVTVPVRSQPEELAAQTDSVPAQAPAQATKQEATKPTAQAETAAQSEARSNEAPSNVVPPRSFGVSSDLAEIISDTAERHEVDPELVKALVKVESNFNPRAISYKGAMGMMQLMPATARRLGVRNAFDPEQNLDGGVRHLKYLLGLYDGNLPLSLAAYNAGEGAVQRYNGIPPYAETKQYVRKISSLYGNVYSPASFSRRSQADRWGIMKHVDERGKVHFSNTEGW